ncbi:transcription factor bHLH18-like [Impatiens glandulifera]|uniref:transcription factor bHLH18-like n=1 Tax=Impatiens glandulifera TaxID=253017 RepID=UPI001FB15E97|nr:transcription factor bHLH18-like [Impatiens glandulifera]
MDMTDFGGLFEMGMEDFGFMIPPWTIMESLNENEINPVSFENTSRRQGFEPKRPAEMLNFGPEKPPKIPKSESSDFGLFIPKQVALSPNSVTNFPSQSKSQRTSQAQGHIMAERKRREKLGQRFIALSALIPGLKKMDKASVLTDAIKHLKQLQERVKILEAEIQKKKSMESVVLVKKKKYQEGRGEEDDDDRISFTVEEETLPEIEIKRCSENVLIKIHCEKKKGILEKVIAEIQKFNLSFVNSNVLTFGETILDITILTTIDDEFSMSIKDLVTSIKRIV